MKRTYAVAILMLVMAGVAWLAAAETQSLDRADVAFMTLDFQARFHTSSRRPTRSGIQGVLLNDKTAPRLMHRVLMDPERGLYYGYDVTITPSAGGFEVAFAALGADADRYFAESRWKELCPACAPPRRLDAPQVFPPPRRVSAGDTITLDLLQGAGDDVISDAIRVEPGLVPTDRSKEPARVLGPSDFTAEAVMMRLGRVKLFADGALARPDAGGGVYGSGEGDMFWLDLPDHGRAFFSLVPRPGCRFEKIGVVTGQSVKFRLEGVDYEVLSTVPIVTPGPDAEFNDVQSWKVWVAHDADWKPFQGQYTIGFGSYCPGSGRPS